jgi:hypothetical protein
MDVLFELRSELDFTFVQELNIMRIVGANRGENGKASVELNRLIGSIRPTGFGNGWHFVSSKVNPLGDSSLSPHFGSRRCFKAHCMD